MRESLRKSGIDFVGDVPWGTHFCQFYQTKEDLMDILVPYFKVGLGNNEFCLWVLSQPFEVEDAIEALRWAIPDFDTYMGKGQITIIPHTGWYLNENIFDSGRALSNLVEKINHALDSGYDGLRFGGNMSWMDKEGWNRLVEYEKQINNVIDNCQTIALCTYSFNKCNATEIIYAVSNHQFALVKKEGEWERIENSGQKNIIECKREDAALSQSEQRFRLNVEKRPSPAREMADFELAEIIDAQAIQSLMDDFYKLAHIPIGIIDLKGNILVGVGWQDICTKFHRTNPESCKHCVESDTELSAGVLPGEFKPYKCKNNMWDIATPIMAGSHHVGNIFLGQFFFDDEPLNYELFRSQARKYGFNEEEYIAVLEKVPRLSKEAVDAIMVFFMKFANMFSQLSYSNIKLAKSLAERDYLMDALRESDERFRSVLENALDSAYRRDLKNNCFDYMSPVIEQITGFSAMEIDAMSINDFFDRIHPDDRQLVISGIAQSLDQGFGAHEYRFKCKDGKYCWLADHFSIIKDKTGMNRFRAGIARDITERKQAEEALRSSNLYNRSLIEASLDPLVTIGRDGKITDANGATEQVTGYSRNELLGTDFSDYFTEPREARAGYQQVFIEGEVRDYPLEIQHKDGYITPVLYNASVYRDENGEVIGVFAAARDITESKKTEKALQVSEERYRSLYENSLDGILLTKPDGTILSANPQACLMFGMTEDEIIRLGRDGVVVNDEKLAAALEEREWTGRMRAELTYGRKDGSTFVCDTTSKLFVDADGNINTSLIIRDITERKQTEEALRESEAKYRIVADNTYDWEFWLDHDGCFLYISPSCERVTGYQVWEFIDNPDLLREIIHPDDRQTFLQHQHEIPPGSHGDIEFRIVTKDGEIRWIHHLCQPLYDGEGRYAGSRGSNRDITDRKRAEEEVQGTRNMLQLIMNNIPQGIFWKDLNSRFMGCNKVFAKATGLESPENIVGKTDYDLPWSPEQTEWFREYDRKIVENDTPEYHIIEPQQEADGRLAWVETNKVPLHDSKGNVIGILGTYEDITERKQAEGVLRESGEKFRGLVEHINDWVWEVDKSLVYTYASPRARDLLGYEPADLLGTTPFDYMAPEEADRVRSLFVPILNAREEFSLMENTLIRKDGSTVTVETSGVPMYDSQGNFLGYRGIDRDITERKRAEEILTFERSQLLSIFDGMDDMVYVADPYTYELLYVNKAMKEKFGGEYVGRVCYREFQRRDSPCDFCTNQIILKERNKPYRWEYYNPKVNRFFMIMDRIIIWPDGREVRLEIAKDITERKKAEEALRLSNLYNRSLIEASLDPLVTIGPDGKITDVNGATEHVTGYSRNDLIGTDFSDYFTEPEKASTGYEQVFIEGEVRDYPLEIQHKDGYITPVLYNASVYRDENGEVIGVFAAARDITERKIAEEALKKAHDNLEKLVEERTTQLEKAYNSLKESEEGLYEAQKIAHVGNWEWDIATGKTQWSDELYRIFGLNPQESTPTSDEFFAFIHPDDREYVVNAIMAALKGKPYGGIDYRIILANGEERIVNAKSEVIFDEENSPVRVKGIIQDITGRKKTEEKIQTLANAVESSNDAIVTESLDGIITSWNKAAEQIYGYSAEEILGKNVSILEPDNVKGEIKYFSEKIKQGKKVQHYETLQLRKDGNIINISVTLSSILNASGERVALSAIVRDITERKRQEEILRESEARLRRFYESGMFGVLYYNLDGSITDANDKFLEIVGYTREDLRAGQISWNKMTPPEYRFLDEQCIAELKNVGVIEPHEKEYIRKDGSHVPIILGIATLDQAHHEGIAFVLDITERKKSEKALAEMDKIRIKEIHHRIKNNLQVISSLLDLQAEKFQDKEVLEAFKESQNRVLSMSLIHEELYKGEGTETLDFSAYLRKLSENLLKTYGFSSKNIRLYIDLEEKAFFDMDTAVPLGIIVNELVSNSLKHAFTDNQEGEIRIRLCREDRKNEINESPFSLTISDNGKGIPEDMELGSLDSLGLQLVITLVDQLDGEIEIKRAHGTEFRITFNLAEKS